MLGTAGIGLTRGRSRDPFGLSTAELGESYLERVIEAKPEWVLLRSTLMQLRQSKRKTASRTAIGNIPREDRWEAVSDLPDTERFAFLLDEVEQEYSRVERTDDLDNVGAKGALVDMAAKIRICPVRPPPGFDGINQFLFSAAFDVLHRLASPRPARRMPASLRRARNSRSLILTVFIPRTSAISS
jgi:hypothetical protein